MSVASWTDVLTPAQVEALRRAALESPLLGESPLSGTFLATRGFSITWKSTFRSRLELEFPALQPFLEAALDPQRLRQVMPRVLGLRVKAPVPNAFYLNVLLVPQHAGVDAHVDATLSTASSPGARVPVAVAVAYVDVPADLVGGRLWVQGERGQRSFVTPQAGMLAVFRGNALHGVEPVSNGQLRVSWVLECYALPASELAEIHDYKINSKAGFPAYLKHANRHTAVTK